MADARGMSAASRVFLAFLGAVVVITGLLATLLAFQAQATERAEAESVTLAVARTIAEMPEVADAVATPDATARLQPIAVRIMDTTPIDFVTIMTPDGIRLTHRDPAEIGKHYLGTIEPGLAGRELTEEAIGTLGPSLRSVVPVIVGGDVVALVSAGITLGSVGGGVLAQLPFVVAIAAALAGVGLLAAWLAGRWTRRVAGDLPASAVRDAVSSYESIRTLGEALRAQTHEHGNRMHTAVSLLELGRTDEAIEILTETSRQSQRLVDQVAARRDGDPTVGALLLGKAAQARERGVDWTADIDPVAPRSILSPVDAVSVVGNLIDNALDAAAAGPEPRWVRISFAPAGDDLRISVSDSGDGVEPGIRHRIFVHGFSTKPAGADGRGVGLALVREIVEAGGGTVSLDDAPTTFSVVLPRRRG